MTRTVNVTPRRPTCPAWWKRQRAGEEIVIAKAGKPMARLVPLATVNKGKRPAGLLAGRIPKEFYDPLPDDIIDLFYNGPIFPDNKS